ncbi:hypothetical protein AQ946_23735 [Burkholderia pseudomallei]|uniref:hypothetical protein n=1 Tax=Burkholderia pseudomallei TaxID=28450 RepID=UPI0005726F1B|nr:hypothetical protein [Burkholderia pseudomallei]OMR94568.1 hypothetical protein AQ732_26750 [Burkholderia pseudomallei]ONE22373.1 hypothetical protein AQ946_23735 [Burkholderia pseudomallei]ONE36593.1 hypothetical protein AQ947_18805 [Burkholderia pseudomallei]ONE37307.1 hypothetical protein AQ948_16510 [Burkholderia pseudomallei]
MKGRSAVLRRHVGERRLAKRAGWTDGGAIGSQSEKRRGGLRGASDIRADGPTQNPAIIRKFAAALAGIGELAARRTMWRGRRARAACRADGGPACSGGAANDRTERCFVRCFVRRYGRRYGRCYGRARAGHRPRTRGCVSHTPRSGAARPALPRH